MLNVTELTDDGVIDSAEVVKIRADLYEDDKIDREEMDILFEINDLVTGNANCPEYIPLFAKAIKDGVLADDVSPGVVDEDEADYLIEKMGADGQVDAAEKAALQLILDEATEVHQKLVDYARKAGVTKSA